MAEELVGVLEDEAEVLAAAFEEGGGGSSYALPIATPDTLGGVKPAAKTEAMTQTVGVDENGELWTGTALEFVCRAMAEENVAGLEVTGLNITSLPVSIRLYSDTASGDFVGSGLIVAVNGKRHLTFGGGVNVVNANSPLYEILLYSDDGGVKMQVKMRNSATYRASFDGVQLPVESIYVSNYYAEASAAGNTDQLQYYPAGTTMEIYKGVYPSVF